MSDRLFISLMPYLKHKSGHDCIYHHHVKEAIDAQGIDYVGYISSDCTLSDLPTCWNKWFSDAGPGPSIFKRLKRRYCDFAGIFKKSTDKQRIFFIETFSKLDLAALLLSVLWHSRRSDTFWLLFRYPNVHSYRMLSRLLHKKLGSRLICLTDSEKIGETFKGLPFQPFVWPIPHTRSVQALQRQGIICWWPGPPRETKGWDDIRRLTQLKDPFAKYFTLVVAQSSGLTNAELIPDQLSEDEYTQKLSECHVVLLPYDPKQYSASTSGIFVEAVVANKIPLVKEGTWMAYELKRFDLHELIVDWNRSDFFSSIQGLLENGEIKRKLGLMQRSYANFHNPEQFQKSVAAVIRE